MTALPVVVGVARSLLTYYAAPFRLARLQRLARLVLSSGDLAFDIGSHAGNRIYAWTRMGVRVVALEPHPTFYRILRRLYGRYPGVTLISRAAGAAPGWAELRVSRLTPSVSTLSADWTRRVRRAASFARLAWEDNLPVEVTTLDELIARFGVPAFCKIDVEGMEHDVLLGLNVPLPCLSFEYVPVTSDIALRCVERLEALGPFEYNWSVGERHRWARPEWARPDAVRAYLAGLPPEARSGDIYARLRPSIRGG